MAYHGTEFQVFEGVTSAELTPEEGRAWRVFRISVVGGSEGDTIEIKVGKTSVFYSPVVFGGKTLFDLPGDGQNYVNLFDALKAVGKELKIPVPSGNKLTITLSFTATILKVEYEVWDSGDVRPNEPNGPESNEMIYLGWVANGSAVTSTGYVTLNTSKLPPEYPDFPAEPVPAGFNAEVFALAVRPIAGSVGDGSATKGTSYSTKARLFYKRQVLFDPNREGWVVLGNSGYSETGTTMTYDYSSEHNELIVVPPIGGTLKTLEPTLSIPAGEELNVQVHINHTTDVDIPAGEVQAIAFIHLKPGR